MLVPSPSVEEASVPHLAVFICNGSDQEDELLTPLYWLRAVGVLDLVGPILAGDGPYDAWTLKVPPDLPSDHGRGRLFWRLFAAVAPLSLVVLRLFTDTETRPTAGPSATLFVLIRNVVLGRVSDSLRGVGANLWITTLGGEAYILLAVPRRHARHRGKTRMAVWRGRNRSLELQLSHCYVTAHAP